MAVQRTLKAAQGYDCQLEAPGKGGRWGCVCVWTGWVDTHARGRVERLS